jgi:hypothetical protein
MSSNPRLDAALMVLRDAGHRIGDVHIPPPAHPLAMRIWIDRISCTFEGVLKMAEEERKTSEQLGSAFLEIRVNSVAGVRGESRPPSSHRMLTTACPLNAILTLVTVPDCPNSFLT